MYMYWTLVLVLAAISSTESGWNGFQVGGMRFDGLQSNKPHYNLQTTFQNFNSALQPPHVTSLGGGSPSDFRFGVNVPSTRLPSTATVTSTVSSTTVKSTTISTTTIGVPNTKTINFEFCVKKCRISQELKPVCGSDGVTYKNPSSLKCARDCGIDVLLDRPGRCEIDDDTFTEKSTEAPVTPSPEVIRACLLRCPTTTEYNPVCGSDGVTYANRGRLECARYCGVDVTMSRASKCPPNPVSPTTAPVTPSPSKENIYACIANCPVTTEYNPVCGSDGVTYKNPSRLECAKICGINVQVTRFSRCPAIVSSTPATPRPTTPTLSISTPSISTPSPTIATKPSTPSTPAATPVTPVTNVETPTTSGQNFTISQEVLDAIFTTDYSGLINERHED